MHCYIDIFKAHSLFHYVGADTRPFLDCALMNVHSVSLKLYECLTEHEYQTKELYNVISLKLWTLMNIIVRDSLACIL